MAKSTTPSVGSETSIKSKPVVNTKSVKSKFAKGRTYVTSTVEDPKTGDPVRQLTVWAKGPGLITGEDHAALMRFLAELDFNGGRVIPRSLLEKHGIFIEGDAPGAPVSVRQAMHQTAVLITSLEEVIEYDPHRHHNQPPPALWVNDPSYVRDVSALLRELQRLNDLLEKNLTTAKPASVAKGAGAFAAAGKKFLESYADLMGKSAAALTIGGMASLSIYLGADKGTVEAFWNYLKLGK